MASNTRSKTNQPLILSQLQDLLSIRHIFNSKQSQTSTIEDILEQDEEAEADALQLEEELAVQLADERAAAQKTKARNIKEGLMAFDNVSNMADKAWAESTRKAYYGYV
jgi:hypothetical protein